MQGLEIKSWLLFFLARLIDHEETWNYTVIGALGCMNNADFEKKEKKKRK